MAHTTEMQAALDKHPAHKTNLELQLVNAELTRKGKGLKAYHTGFLSKLNGEPPKNPYNLIQQYTQYAAWNAGYMAANVAMGSPITLTF